MPAELPADLHEAADVADLIGAGFGELDAAFEAAAAPAPSELDGSYHGRLLAVNGVDRLPGPVGGLIGGVFTEVLTTLAGLPLFPWRGKHFGRRDGDRLGSNIWLTPWGPHFGNFTCTVTAGSLTLDYDVSSNLPPLRPIKGAIRRLAPGLYLGRMVLRMGAAEVPILFFTLDNS